MSQHIVHKKISIAVPAIVVWEALTNPEKTKQYFFGCKVFSDWKPGSDITFKGRMFWIIPFEMHGKIVAVQPARLLQYTLLNKDGSRSEVTDRLEESDGITTLSITDDVGCRAGVEKRYARSQKGWDKILTGLKQFVERSQASTCS
jgi:uncharacterized protein YndB with AHSA1/START domain